MKGLHKFLLVCTATLAIAVGFAACETGEPHTHHFSYAYDGEYHWFECSGCDEIEDRATHTFVDGVCSACRYEDPEYLPPHSHNWSWTYDGQSHWQACDGCDETQREGAHLFTDGVCSECGYEDPEYLAPHSHVYGEWQITAPDENTTGSAVKTCSTCGEDEEDHTVTVTLPVLGSSQYIKTADTATCTDGGEVQYSITIDGQKFTFTVSTAAKGHTLEPHAATAESCTQSGNTAYWECSVCGKYFSDEKGTEEIKEDSWIIEATGHTLISHPEVAADCEADGNRAYWECSVCGKYFSDEKGTEEIKEDSWVIDATGHAFGDNWSPDMYFGHFRYSNCKHQIFEEQPHTYRNGVCETCGYEQPKVYYDEDAPEGETGYIIVYEWGEIYADVYIPYLLGQTDPEMPFTTFYPESFFETGYDGQYGISWQTQIYVNRTYYILNFYCDFENGNTFKISSLAQRYEFTQTVDESYYLVYLYQNIHQTPFCELNKLTNVALYKTKADGTGKEYMPVSRTEYYVEENYLYLYCAPEEGKSVERVYRVDIAFEQSGKIASATISHVHTYGEWEIDFDYHAHYPTCEHYDEIIVDDHSYVDGVCEVCGFKQPTIYTDVDGTEATISTFEINGEKIVRFWLPQLIDDGGFAFGNDKSAEDVIAIAKDDVYGTLWETEVVRFSGTPGRPLRPEVLFRIQFFWNPESSTTFKLYSVSRYIELSALYLRTTGANLNFTVVLLQSFYETDFFPEYLLLGVGFYINGIDFGPTGYVFDDDDKWILIQKDVINYLIEISYDEKTGWANAATVIRCYIGDIPSEDGAWIVRIILYYDTDGTLTVFEVGCFGYEEEGKVNFLDAEIMNDGGGTWIVTVTDGNYAGIYMVSVATNATNDDFDVTVTKQ